MSVDLRLWLGTFHNQRMLTHQVSIIASISLLATGFISFVVVSRAESGNFKDFDGAGRRVTLAWSIAAVGIASTFLNLFMNTKIQKSERFDSNATDEQMAIRRLHSAAISCLSLSAISVGLFVFFGLLTSNGFVGPPMLVFFTAFVTLVTAVYDAASVLRKGRIELDEANAVPLTVDEFDA